jgi:hypothetical protein
MRAETADETAALLSPEDGCKGLTRRQGRSVGVRRLSRHAGARHALTRRRYNAEDLPHQRGGGTDSVKKTEEVLISERIIQAIGSSSGAQAAG